MVKFSQNFETQYLIQNINKNGKWNLKRLKWIFGVIFVIILLLVPVYILCNLFISDNSVQPESKKDVMKAINPLYITSIATTNDDYLKQCAPQVKCDSNAKYRNINGSCNNLKIATWGASGTPFYRILNANYSDGYYKIRIQTNGSDLPNPRVINTHIFLGREVFHADENNVLLTPFGQLVAHDIAGLRGDIIKNKSNSFINCCDDQFVRKTYAQCQVVIDVPLDDPVYSQRGISCLEIVRVLTSRNYSCPLNPTTFINNNTHFIDASEVYGSSENDARKLRTMKGGTLRFSTSDDGQMFCPFLSQENNEPVELQQSVEIQYDSGNSDGVNQNLGITAMQTLFLRYHNYIANKLLHLNPQWTDEVLYQESRRIVIATIQHNTYEHFLPIIIGEDFQQLYGLNEENIYDPTVIPSIAQEFASAGYRMLHSLIPVQFNFMNNNYSIESSMNITDWMRDSSLLPKDHNFDKLLKGFLETPGRITQHSYNFYISNFMFSYSSDLMSSDITIGRDVGLQPYNKVRHLCGLPLAKDFDDLLDSMHIRDINKLKELYHSVNDIDLIVGLILEKRCDGAIVGHTTRCLIADSFYRSKAGDRFFYDVQGQPGSFTPDQLKTIKKITLGHVLCASSNVDHIQTNVFKVVDHNLFPTSKLRCDDAFSLDLKYWKEPNNQSEL